MKQYKLSICIPARHEMFLKNTVEDILKNKEDDTEIIIGLDGQWSDPPLDQHPDVNVIYVPESMGQRAMTNLCVKLSKAKYVMKLDAHCAFDKGFDRKMLEAFKESGDNVTMMPTMKNLHAFDWKCYKCGWKKYQGPTPLKCESCGDTTQMKRKMIWEPRPGSSNYSFCFDSEPHFQYWSEFTKRNDDGGDLTETMSIQGSCFMMTREKYWELNISDESFGSWGSQGIEVACKTWLSGGRVLVNKNTWYAHMFRTQGGDFGFPYPQQESKIQAAKAQARELFFNNKWDKQIYPLSWLIDKFWPIKGWTQEDRDNLPKTL